MSYVKAMELVTICIKIVTLCMLLLPDPGCERQVMIDSLNQPVKEHAVAPVLDLTLYSTAPKFHPARTMEFSLTVAMLDDANEETVGTSYEAAFEYDPIDITDT